MIDDGACLCMLQAVRASGASPLVRVPWLAPAPVLRALDLGAHGVICPMVQSPAQAAELVSFVRSPPIGPGASARPRAAIFVGARYGEQADARVLGFAMIETARAHAEIEAIAAMLGKRSSSVTW